MAAPLTPKLAPGRKMAVILEALQKNIHSISAAARVEARSMHTDPESLPESHSFTIFIHSTEIWFAAKIRRQQFTRQTRRTKCWHVEMDRPPGLKKGWT